MVHRQVGGAVWLGGLVVSLIVVLPGCGGGYQPSALITGDLPAQIEKVCAAKTQLQQPVDHGSWADPKTPDYRNRSIVVNLSLSAEEAKQLFGEVKQAVFDYIAANGAKITNPTANEAASPSALDSYFYRYVGERSRGNLTLNLHRGHCTLERNPNFEGAIVTDAAVEGNYSIEVTVNESPSS